MVDVISGRGLDDPEPERQASSRRLWMAAVSAALVSVLVYIPTLDNPFVYDDYRLIVENPTIQELTDLRSVFLRDITRPLVNLTYILDTAVWGTRPLGYHLTNVVLHGLNVVAVFWVAWAAADDWRRKGGGRFGFSPRPTVVAMATSVLVAVHPAMTQAVGYVTARSELLYALFALLSWIAARRWMHDGGAWWAPALACWLLALLGKETAAMLPLVLWAYDAWLIEDWTGTRARRIRRLYVPLVLLVVAFGAGRLVVLATLEYPKDAGPDWRFAFVAVDAFWQHVALFIWPRGQTLMHTVSPLAPTSVRAIAGTIGLVGLIGVVWALRRVQAVVALGILMCVLLLVPSSVLFTMGIGEPMAEHRAYGSAMGFFLAMGAVVGMVWALAATVGRGRMMGVFTACVVVVQLTVSTLIRNAVWDSPVALAREAVALSPAHWMPHLFLGETLRQDGRCAEAIPEYRSSLRYRPTEIFTRQKLLGCLLLTGRIAESERELHALRSQDPASTEAAMGLGLLAMAQGRTDASRRYFAEIVGRDPGHPDARRFLALLDGSLGASERSALCEVVRTLTSVTAPNHATARVCD